MTADEQDFKNWCRDVQTCIRQKTNSPGYFIEESDYPLYEMFSNYYMSAPDAADDIINRVNWD